MSLVVQSAPCPHGSGLHGSVWRYVGLTTTRGDDNPSRAEVQGERTSPAWEAAARATRQI